MDGQAVRAGAIVSPHHLANAAGEQVLRDGGNAIEAAIAVSAALTVVYPHFWGLGGDAIWTVADGEGMSTCIMGIGQAAQAAQAAPAPGSIPALPVRGARSALTRAAVVDVWRVARDYSALHWDGKFREDRLLADAMTHAKAGFQPSDSQLFWTDFRRDEFGDWPGFYERFGQLAPTQELFVQPELAESLALLAQDGLRSFYDGALARKVAAGLDSMSSPITKNDLSATTARLEKPLVTGFGAYSLLAPPPPTQGLTTLQILSILDRLDIGNHAPGSASFYHLCVEAVKQGFLRRRVIADPDFVSVPLAAEMDADFIGSMAGAISANRALEWPNIHQKADTVFLAVTDSLGRSVSALQSIYFDWGSGMTVGDTGILWHNRGSAFSMDRQSPNAIAPGKRPFHTLNPGIGLRDGKPALLYGTQGADGQPQTLSVVVSALAAHGLDPTAALALPRFLLGRAFADSNDTLKIERNAGEETLETLSGFGHSVALIVPMSPLAGQAGAIAIAADGAVSAAHDPRGDGGALIVNAL